MAQSIATAGGLADTFPKLLLRHAAERPARVAIREKEYGIWLSYDWRRVREEVEALACGLAAAGFRRGDRLIIVGDNRPHLYWAIAAAQALGGIPVPVYQDSVAEELLYILDHAGSRSPSPRTRSRSTSWLEIQEHVAGLDTSCSTTRAACATTTQPGLMLLRGAEAQGPRLRQGQSGLLRGRDRQRPGADMAA